MADFLMDRLLMPVIIFMIVSLALGAAVVVYQNLSAETFSLRKDEWACVASRDETYLQPMVVGPTTMLIPMTRAVCDRWDRKDER